MSATLTLFARAENVTLVNSSDNNSNNVHPSLLPTDTPQDTIETEKTYPVGKGIVYSKHSFFVRKKNKMEGDGSSSKSRMDAVHFLGNLLGLDTTNLESGSSSSSSSNRSSGGDHREIKKNDMDDNHVEKMGSMWEELPLFGDDGYKPRATPKGCAELEHMDQMIWDQQGDRGAIVKSQEKKTKLTSSDKSVSNEDENDEDVIEDDNNSNSGSESERRQQRKVHHKQRQFLKQFRGKALEVDSSTGCPVPSLALTR
ncbi:hypothetical protein BGZ99_003081 [Dissophora globulifera]|uniref:Uncharacterized protein n=1 Tax=Dissophora globulifera TaxID=979702 RepID=A0A9P6V0E6_9FUNG|nr:hypothetical protein BGZ99_003081 [Dissophora globulifera]